MNLEVRGISVGYVMRRTGETLAALEDLSFRIPERAFVTIVGPSGCGKTTLLRVIAGLQSPTAGSVKLDGRPLGPPGKDRAMVFQTPALLPWRSVIRNVSYGLELQGVDRRRAVAKAREYLELVGLHGFGESYPGELSEGMRQRVNLARALAAEPRLLLLDEPFAALDAQTRAFMQVELESIWERTGSTALFVTHQITEAPLLGDIVVVLSGRPGRVLEMISVDLPRPRTIDIKREPSFNILEERIWELIGQEASAMHNQDVPGMTSD
ncbi:MAG: ABC transporter ATP-binding protein [Anaerolineales bacterium]